MGIYKQTDTKHTQVRIEQASSAKNCSEGEMLRHFNALYYLSSVNETYKSIFTLKKDRWCSIKSNFFLLRYCIESYFKVCLITFLLLIFYYNLKV